MNARVQIVPTLPEPMKGPDAGRPFIEAIERQPGFRGVHLLLQIGTRQGLCLTLWDSAHDAEAMPERTEAVLGPRPFRLALDEVYDVLDTASGPAAP